MGRNRCYPRRPEIRASARCLCSVLEKARSDFTSWEKIPLPRFQGHIDRFQWMRSCVSVGWSLTKLGAGCRPYRLFFDYCYICGRTRYILFASASLTDLLPTPFLPRQRSGDDLYGRRNLTTMNLSRKSLASAKICLAFTSLKETKCANAKRSSTCRIPCVDFHKYSTSLWYWVPVFSSNKMKLLLSFCVETSPWLPRFHP